MRQIATSNWFMDWQKYPKSRTSIRIWQPETLDSIKCHTFPGMGDRSLKDTSCTIQFFFVPKVLIHPGGPLKWFYCALQLCRIWFYGLCVHEPASLTWNYGTHELPSQLDAWPRARAAVSDNLKACLAADLGFKEIYVDAQACDFMAARVAGSAAGPPPRHQPSESESAWGTKAIYIYCNYYLPCKHAGSVLVVKAAGCYAHDCGFEAGALHGVSFLYFLFMAEWYCICHVCTWYIHGLNMYVHKHKCWHTVFFKLACTAFMALHAKLVYVAHWQASLQWNSIT